jgi:hypothetical protein
VNAYRTIDPTARIEQLDAWVRAGRICVARDERAQAAATLAQALHNDDEPGQ